MARRESYASYFTGAHDPLSAHFQIPSQLTRRAKSFAAVLAELCLKRLDSLVTRDLNFGALLAFSLQRIKEIIERI